MNSSRFYTALLRSVVVVLGLVCPPEFSGQVLPLRNYTTRDGLPSNHISALCQDSRGFLWIGTDEGLGFYDGESFKIYSTIDGLVNNYVSSVIESRHSPGRIWIASIAGGVSKYEDGRFTTFPIRQMTSKIYIGTLAEDHEGTLWCTTSDGIYRIQGDSLQPFPLHPPQYIYGSDIAVAQNGSIWIGVNRNLYIYTPSSGKTRLRDLNLPPNSYVGHIVADREGDIWVSSSDSTLRRFHGEGVVSWSTRSYGMVNQIMLDASGELWMTAPNGILRTREKSFPAGRMTVYSRENGFQENYFDPVLEDNEGNIWFGGAGTGLYKLSEKNALKIPLENGMSGFTDPAGHLWLLNGHGLWECWNDEGRWVVYDHRLGEPAASHGLSLTRSEGRGRFWLQFPDSTVEGDSIIARPAGPSALRKFATLKPGRDFPRTFVWMVYDDPKDFLWMSLGQGVGVVDLHASPPRFVTLFRQEDELMMSSIRAIYRDSRGNVWFGSFGEGLSELVGGDISQRRFQRFTTSSGLPDNSIRSLAEDERGRLWIGTRFGGASIYDGSGFQNISMKEGLVSNTVWHLTRDEQHRMWLGTGAGAMSVSSGDFPLPRWSEIMTREPCAVYYSSVTKTVWIVHAREAIALGEENKIAAPPHVYISKVTVNDRPVSLNGPMVFTHDLNNIVVEFIGPGFRGERGMRYQYWLRGIDTAWSIASRQRSVTFASLSPQEYTFEVAALNTDGLRSPSPASFSFRIMPPVWQQWWFIGLVGATLLGGAFGLVRRKMSVLKERHAMQEEFSRRLIDAQENERSRIAAELHDSLGQNLLVIKNDALLALDAGPGKQEVSDRLNDISDVSTQTIGEVRDIALDLRPYHLDKLGLTTSIESIIRRSSESGTLALVSDIDPIDNVFPKGEEIHIYRIVQEALNNVAKHSEATEASVSVKRNFDRIRVTVRDNGKGFEAPRSTLPGPGEFSRGFGLFGLGERARILGGTLQIGSAPGQGTTLILDLPIRGDHDA